jgi:hypothetical protein
MSKTVDVLYRLSVTDRASAGFRKVADGSRKARREVEGLESAAEDAGDAIEDAFDGDAVEGLSEELDKARRKTRQLGEEARESGRGFEGMAKSAKGALKAIAAAEVTKFFVKQGKAAVAAAADIESYQATLETMLGSTQAARDRMEEYKDIAKITPFGLEDVVEGGNQLQAIGRYSRENLEMLGDLAAASNKPMEQVMNAYAKLATGQKGEASRMFQDLLISRNDWIAATGKGASKNGELLASTEEMMAALPKIMQSKGFFGMMAKQAEKANGMFSNLGDSVFSLRAALGERMMPTVKSVTGVLTGMVNTMEKAVRVPLAEKIAQEKVELNLLVGALERSWEKEDQRGQIINELNNKFPDFLKNINLEKEGLEGVRAKLVDVNAEYNRRIKLSMAADELEKWQEKYDEAAKNLQAEENAQTAKARREEIARIASNGQTSGLLMGLSKDAKGRWVADVFEDDLSGTSEGGPINKTIELPGMDDALAQEYKMLAKYARNTHSNEYSEKQKKAMEEALAEKELIKKMYDIGDEKQPGATETNGSGGGSNGQDGQNGPAVQGGATPGGATVAGTTYGGGSGSGGGSGKTVTTNIGTLVGTIEIHTTTLQEGAAEVKRLVTQALLEAVPSDL